MNVSRVKRTLVLAAFGAALMMAGRAVAQVDAAPISGPVDLSPPARSKVLSNKRRPKPENPTLPSSGDGVGGVVETQVLADVNPDVAGAMSEDAGGFGAAMWRGTDRKVLDHLLAQIPVTSASPAMRDLMRRLLLTGADVPKGGRSGELISVRAGQLLAMGDFVGVNALLGVVPGYTGNPDLLRVEVDARLLTGDVARACQVTRAHIEEQSSVYWQKAFIFCQALDGQGEQAQIGIALLQELGVEDQVFFRLVDALSNPGKPPVIDSLADPSPLHLALARVAKAKLPIDVISSNRPGVLRAIAISPNAAPDLRLEAAERAESAGALPVDDLRQLYASIEFSEQALKNPLTEAAKLSGPMSRALLYRATLSQTVPAAQAEALTQALKLARVGGRYASTARAFLPQLTRVAPSADLAWFAPEAIRVFLTTGRYEGARAWFALLQSAAEHDAKLAAEQVALMPMARLSGFDGAASWTLAQFPAWWQTVKGSKGARDKAALLIATFEALGESAPDQIWATLIAGPSRHALVAPHPSLWFLLDEASKQARLGETVLLSLVILGEGGPANADPIVLSRVLKALVAVGLNDEARALALEAVVAAGL